MAVLYGINFFNMKEIQPFTFWANGKTFVASFLYLICNTDNLKDSAQFYWAFYDKIDGVQGNKICEGNLIMINTKEEAIYDLWDNNDFAWSWAASSLGVTITGATIGEGPVVTKKAKK
jgi:hypothetical protein